MDVFEVIRARRSVRAYLDAPVEADKLERILQAVNQAPACTYAVLAAAGLGLSTVWVGAFDEAGVSRVLDLPAAHRPVVMLPLGYAAEQPLPRDRRNLNELVHHT